MRRWKKIALALLLLLLVSQTPFVYRRVKLTRLQRTINELNAQRATTPATTDGQDAYADYHGVMHVHSSLGGHSTGTFDEIVRAAKHNGLAFVVMTEHPSKHVKTSETTLKGVHDGVLFVAGSEINPEGEDRLLVVPGIEPTETNTTTPSVVTNAKSDGGRLVFVAYPEQLRSWELTDYDGIEVYNLFTNSKRINYALLFFDGLWSYWSYPHLLFATFYERPAAQLAKWDELMSKTGRPLVAVAGNDAHQNVGFSLQHQTGERVLQLQLDPYERSFQVVRTHVLIEKQQTLTTEALLSSLARGHSYIAFDLFCEASGFRFTAENGAERRVMGDEIALGSDGVRLKVTTPVRSRMLFLRDGQIIDEARDATEKELTTNQKGVYRVEVYLDQLGEPVRRQPWIISNPIYVR
ncbi:MAG TPA: hypothetical protein VF666_16885 [Pyrinomonadaceae bacterium]|jgi:hypothetical protein